MTGSTKVSGLRHKRGKKSYPRVSLEMFHMIYNMYSDIKNKEETNAALLLTIMSYHKYINKVSITTLNSHANYQNEYPLQVITIVPPDLHQIQPRSTQV